MAIHTPIRAHLPGSVNRWLDLAWALPSLKEPRRAVKALDALPRRSRVVAGRTMTSLARFSTRGSRRTGRAALLEASGRYATGDMARSHAILKRVAAADGASELTRVDIGLLMLQVHDIGGARGVVDSLDQAGQTGSAGYYRLRARTELATARYPEAVASARMAVTLAPERKSVRTLLAHATAQRDVHDPDWRPSLAPPAARHVAEPGNVLHIVSNALPHRQSGYAIRTQSIGQAQSEVGLRPLIAARRQQEIHAGIRPPDRWQVGGVDYALTASGLETVDRPDQAAAMNARGVAALVEQHRASVLHPATTWLNLQVALTVGAQYGLPVVYEARGFREETWTAKQPDLADVSDHYQVEAALETALMQQADAVITLSDGMRDRLVERGIAASAITVITNAVDVERFRPIPRDATLAKRLRLADGPVIGYISTMAVFEGIETLIQATAELRRRGRSVQCLLVGDGDAYRDLVELARSLGLDDRSVIFTGRVAHADINAYHSLIDVFVVPRRDVGVARLVTPLKPYEAMAMERAVVMSRLDALMGMIIEGETGVSFTPGDAQDLADVIEPLLLDPDRRRSLGEAAGAWVRENRSWRRNGELYLDLYRRLGVA